MVSTPGAKFTTIDINNFYLDTHMERFEYMRLKLSDLSDDVIKQYNISAKVPKNGYIYIKVRKGMYGLLKAGILAQELLEK